MAGHGAVQEPAFEALKLEKRVGWATALLEDIPQAGMSVVAAVYLQEVTPDMVRSGDASVLSKHCILRSSLFSTDPTKLLNVQVANTAGAIVMALRIMWLAYRTFLLSDRERPLMASSGKSLPLLSRALFLASRPLSHVSLSLLSLLANSTQARTAGPLPRDGRRRLAPEGGLGNRPCGPQQVVRREARSTGSAGAFAGAEPPPQQPAGRDPEGVRGGYGRVGGRAWPLGEPRALGYAEEMGGAAGRAGGGGMVE